MKWQPIETAPKDGRLLWLIEDGEEWGLGRVYQFSGYWMEDSHYRGGGYWAYQLAPSAGKGVAVAAPTHWMPIPDPPREELC